MSVYSISRIDVKDWDAYRERLERTLGRTHQVMRPLLNRAKRDRKRIVFPEGANGWFPNPRVHGTRSAAVAFAKNG